MGYCLARGFGMRIQYAPQFVTNHNRSIECPSRASRVLLRCCSWLLMVLLRSRGYYMCPS